MKTFLLALLSVTAAFSFQVVPTRRVIAIDMKIMKIPQSEIDEQGIEECENASLNSCALPCM